MRVNKQIIYTNDFKGHSINITLQR